MHTWVKFTSEEWHSSGRKPLFPSVWGPNLTTFWVA